jgi:hypothetical protein
MMFRTHKKRAAGAVLAVLGAWAVIACTHDFDAYQAGADGAETSTPPADGSSADGSTPPPPPPPPGNDGSTPPPDSSTPPGDAGCAAVMACASTETSCRATCDQTAGTCVTGCGGNNACKKDCNNKRDACYTTCGQTCRSCTGTACTSLCK